VKSAEEIMNSESVGGTGTAHSFAVDRHRHPLAFLVASLAQVAAKDAVQPVTV